MLDVSKQNQFSLWGKCQVPHHVFHPISFGLFWGWGRGRKEKMYSWPLYNQPIHTHSNQLLFTATDKCTFLTVKKTGGSVHSAVLPNFTAMN